MEAIKNEVIQIQFEEQFLECHKWQGKFTVVIAHFGGEEEERRFRL